MIKRLRTIGLFAAASALALAGCTNQDDGEKGDGAIPLLRVGSKSVSNLDYSKNNLGHEIYLGNLILEPLVALNHEGRLTPWLAESWTQPNPTTYIYQLRHDVEFSSGNEMTATDVAFSLNYYRRPGSVAAYNFPATLASITAVDRYTVEVKLSKPNAVWSIVPTGSNVGIFEKAFFDDHKSTFGRPGTGVVGTGPWTLTSFDPTTGAELDANTHYWGGRVPIQKISWRFFSNENGSAIAMRAGRLDVAFPSDNRAWAATSGVEPKTAEGGTRQGDFTMNTLAEPWNDVHVRRAVAYALDKEALINAAGGYAQQLNSLIPEAFLRLLGDQEEVEGVLASLPQYPYSVEKAKQEMALSAYPRGVDVTLTTENSPYQVNLHQAIVPMLEAVGIHAQLKVEMAQNLYDQETSADRESVPSGFWLNGAVNPDPGGAWDSMIGSRNATAGNWNVTNWSSPRVDELLALGFAETDPKQRLRIYQELLTEFADNVPYVPLFLTDATVALSENFTWPSFQPFHSNAGPWALGIKVKD
ncbi:ABC transporter substrate-binding protein [Pedococcus sp. P5_B7]